MSIDNPIPAMPGPSAPPPNKKLGPWGRLRERYRWMSLRNKIALWALVVFLIVGAISLQWVRPAYRASRMWFFLNMADAAVQRKDYNSASLAFRKAIMSGMEYPASWKALAKFLDEVGSPEVINVWERVAGMEPQVSEHRYNQVRTALKYGRVYQAEDGLSKMPPAWKNSHEGLRLRAEVAVRKNQLGEARACLKELLRLLPNDAPAQFALTSLEAVDPNFDVRSAARDRLRALAAGKGEFSLPAQRRLLTLEQQDGNLYEANRLAQKLAESPGANIQDLLAFAQLELETESLSLPVTLEKLRKWAVAHPADFGAVLGWLTERRIDPEATVRWIAGLSENFAEQAETFGPLLQFYLASGQWNRAFVMLRDPKSQIRIPTNVLDLAEKALNEDRDHNPAAESTWMSAIYAAEGKPQTLRVLSLLASARGWSGATGRALGALADAAPGDASAWWLLVQHENAVRNMPGLYKALSGLLRLNPYDINIASNWVLAAAMVRQGDIDEVVEIARRTYSTSPSDSRAATAYAMALLMAKRPAEALQIIEDMSIVSRREPQRAVYVGSVLAANGRLTEAIEYFQRSEELGGVTFPEERRLRRIWKGVALGEATSAEEVERILIRQNDPDVQPDKINAELRAQIERRTDPAEVLRIYNSLKAEAETRSRPSPEVEKLLQEVRPTPAASPAR